MTKNKMATIPILKSYNLQRCAIRFCLDTAQRILLQNINTPTETVFFQEPGFFGSLRQTQKEESRLIDEPRSGRSSSS
ncbi:hypothetical protein NQ318_020113 [Aromia moschata]|uniref:Uncharacterized protein n=1 Tax=Aromia moschata TaxID=1265417 RepID=A0AAV8Z949_9CUCU|nr:hypothetical protein NQ318_020113 [Aromia moschata]